MNKKILIVDDDRSILESLSKVLGAEGYEIALAENGKDAVEKLVEDHVGLMLLDLGMPLKNGWDTLAWLEQINPTFPVVIITGQSNQSERAEKAGADALMEKPLNVPRLLQIIHDLINEPLERRVQRVIRHPAEFLRVACDSEQFREQQNRRFTTPWPSSGAKNN